MNSSCFRRISSPFMWAAVAGIACLASGGCSLWPFGTKERTSIITPAMRAASIREIGPRGEDASPAERQQMCQDLAGQIRTEPDPIVRRAIQETIAEFETPLAQAVLVAGLNDDNQDVRITCCRLLGKRNAIDAVEKLNSIAAADADFDVRIAAVDALGQIKSPQAMRGLAAGLKDRDPAMQFASVEAMKTSTGEDLGSDVAVWRTFADKQLGAGGAATAVATAPGAAPVAR